MMYGCIPVLEESARSVQKFSLNLSNDGDCNFIRCFCADVQSDRGMYSVNIVSLEMNALRRKFDQHLIKAFARPKDSNIRGFSLYQLLQYITIVFIVMGHQYAG